ncbi:MAG: tetratricopeptide repeat protein [Candidatus Ratteibacteria bacterium]
MKKFFVFLLFLSLIVSGQDIDIELKKQAAIDLCNFPNLTEGIVDILYLTIDNYWHSGKYSKIFPIFYLITKILPEDINAYLIGGWFLINGIAPKYLGEEKEKIKNYAIEFMKKGIEKKPEDYRLYFEIAWFYYNEKKFKDAIEYLEKAEKYEHTFYVENLKAHIYVRINEKDKAIKEWEKIKEKYPERKEIAEKFIMLLKEDK